ncbi:autotransporter domain-containing protein [Rhodoligotrophos defluvii]|uniref:autotransporter domain-containing protein n=1 Tax=Rhodoligotrophos defluvii TaxID=2561934 RepID=UPI003D165BB3
MAAIHGSIGAGYWLPAGHSAILTPFVEINGLYLYRPKVEEKGAGNAGLDVHAESIASAEAVVGLSLQGHIASLVPADTGSLFADLALRPELMLSYGRGFGDIDDTVASAFLGAKGLTFQTEGAKLGKDRFRANLALAAEAPQAPVTFAIGYGFEYASRQTNHYLSLSGQIQW